MYPESPQGLKASLNLKTFYKISEMITYDLISFLITDRVAVQKTTLPLFQPILNGVQEIFNIYECKTFLLVSNNSKVDGGISVFLDGGQQC